MTPREIIDQRNVRIYGTAMNSDEGMHRIATCSGPCNQGRASCPCPESCHVSQDDPHAGWGAWVVPALMVFAIVAVSLLWHLSAYLPGGF